MIYNIIAPAGLLLSLFLLFEDILYKKIRNEVVFSGLALVIIFTLAASLYSGNPVIVKVFLIRFLISGIISAGLWYIKGWSAGDAKLFWLLSLFFPPEGEGVISIFNEVFVFLINIFIPVIPVLVVSLIIDSVVRARLSETNVKELLSAILKNALIAIVMMLVSRVVYMNFFSHLPQGKYNLVSMLLIFFIMSSVSKVFS
ncbi:MAG: prepilin peptidase, partial [Deltaproteobacteria bacterium]|nr:prepilin peptidase [Deltaproteobacteria bacterium]